MPLLDSIDHLNVWQRKGQRAPNKPLLLLLALARYTQNGEPWISYREIEPTLKRLLSEFGPPRRSHHPEYPFWRLQNDGLWEIATDGPIQTRGDNTDATVASLRTMRARGRFAAQVSAELNANPELVFLAARRLLDQNFPSSLHGEIAAAVGISLEGGVSPSRSRDPRFREGVLLAYDFRCAICAYTISIRNQVIGLEAVHIKWWQAGGPDEDANGLALCAIHHKLLDYGAFTIDAGHHLIASQWASGGAHFEELVMTFHGKRIRNPQQESSLPDPSFLAWHRKQVFKEPAKPLPGRA